MQGGFANGVDEVLDVTGQPVPGSILQPGIPAACSSIPTTVVCVRPVNPVLRPMLRSGHGRKGGNHGARDVGLGA